MTPLQHHPEWIKMLNGEIYEATNSEFLEGLLETRAKVWEFNNLNPREIEKQHSIIRNLLGSHGENFTINQPFRCDCGCNIHIGENFFANFNLTILDEARVEIGDNAFIGPNVSIFTACHPLDPQQRNTGVEGAGKNRRQCMDWRMRHHPARSISRRQCGHWCRLGGHPRYSLRRCCRRQSCPHNQASLISSKYALLHFYNFPHKNPQASLHSAACGFHLC